MDGSSSLQLVTDAAISDGPVAVFDSGVGGLSVVRHLRRRLPSETIVYFGDTARVPYGSKSPQTVLQFTREIVEFLLRLDPKCLVMACNTVSAVCLPELAAELPLPVIGVVEPGAEAAVQAASDGKLVAVIATAATVSSNAYAEAIAQLDSTVVVVQKACPLLVPLVEEGRDSDDALVNMAIAQYLEPIAWLKPRALVLGCTHYPLLRPAIDRFLGPEVTLVDSGAATAQEVEATLSRAGTLRKSTTPGKLLCYVSDNPHLFQTIGSRFLGEQIPGVLCLRPSDLSTAAVPLPSIRAAAV